MSLGGGAMRRREFIALVGGAAVALPRAVCAQQPALRGLLSACAVGTLRASIFGMFVAAIAATVIGTAASAAERIYLRCSLVGSSGTYTYTLRIDFGAPRITLIGSNEIDLKVERLDDALIIATLNPLPTVKLEWKMSDLPDWPDTAAKIQFRLNRITGDAGVDYLRQQQTTRTGVDWAIVMDGLSQKGTCSKSERAF